jgi:hypothetical protein
MSRLHPGLEFAGTTAVQGVSARRIGGSEQERLLRLSPQPPLATAVHVERTVKKRSSKPGVERSGQGCRQLSMVIAVGN